MMSARSRRAISSRMAGVSTGWGIEPTVPPLPEGPRRAIRARLAGRATGRAVALQRPRRTPRSAAWHHDDGPVLGNGPRPVASVRALVRDLLEAERAPLPEPHLDR